jgi:hypothetical protein
VTRIRLLTLVVLAATPSFAAQPDADASALAAAAKGFYDVYMTLHPSDGIPDPATRAKFEPYVSPQLDHLFAEGNEAEVRYAKATKNLSPPLVEGDPFTPNFEGATSFGIGACAVDTHGGHCAVTLAYDDRKDKPVIWTDTVLLVRTSSGWRVDDIAYGGSRDFGNKGRLKGVLEDAIRNGNIFSK